MTKLDMVMEDKDLYLPPAKPGLVEVPPMQYLMFDGRGAPENNPAFQRAFQALYGIAYTIKFMGKKGVAPEGWQDFKVPPPEGLWWMAHGTAFDSSRLADWRWTLMIRMPSFVTPKLVRQAIGELVAKKRDDVYVNVRLETLTEGPSVQLMHIGPYDSEAADLARMDAYVEAAGWNYRGRHHEIYFGDPRRTRPEKLRTVLRHPVTNRAN